MFHQNVGFINYLGFFIMKGAVAFCTPDARVFRKFFQGAHFAEYTLFTNVSYYDKLVFTKRDSCQ